MVYIVKKHSPNNDRNRYLQIPVDSAESAFQPVANSREYAVPSRRTDNRERHKPAQICNEKSCWNGYERAKTWNDLGSRNPPAAMSVERATIMVDIGR